MTKNNILFGVFLALSGCGPHYSERQVCDSGTQERVFLECVRALKNGPEVLTAAGNDMDEAVSACSVAAVRVACNRWERYCYENCEVTP